jgi:hypothetical protein
MTTREFLEAMQRYYGQAYDPQGEGPAIKAYLDTKRPAYLDALGQVVLLRFSRKWKCLPDIAVFEEHRQEARDRMSEATVARQLPAPEAEVQRSAEVGAMLAQLVGKLTVTAEEGPLDR